MGDRYELIKDCVYCGALKEDIWYAPTCGFLTFICNKCGKENFIVSDKDFTVKKIADVTYDDVHSAISQASNMMNEKQIEACANNTWNNLLKKLRGEKEDD